MNIIHTADYGNCNEILNILNSHNWETTNLLNALDNMGNTPFMTACENLHLCDNSTHMKYLIEYNNNTTNLNHQNISGSTGLMILTINSGNDIVFDFIKYLIETYEINVNIQDHQGTTALMIASIFAGRCKTIRTVKYLINEANALVMITDNNNENCLMLLSKDIIN